MSVLLDFLIRVANAGEEDELDDIGKLAHPQSFATKYDMESHYNRVLGVDPFHHFSQTYVSKKFDEILETAPYSVREQLYQKRGDIISDTLSIADNIEEAVLQRVLHKVVQDRVGWIPNDDSSSNLDEFISLEQYGRQMELEDDESEYDPDYESEEDSDDYEGIRVE